MLGGLGPGLGVVVAVSQHELREGSCVPQLVAVLA